VSAIGTPTKVSTFRLPGSMELAALCDSCADAHDLNDAHVFVVLGSDGRCDSCGAQHTESAIGEAAAFEFAAFLAAMATLSVTRSATAHLN